MITISKEFATELNELIEDSIEYLINDYASRGELISGETAWKIINAYSQAKEAEYQGLLND